MEIHVKPSRAYPVSFAAALLVCALALLPAACGSGRRVRARHGRAAGGPRVGQARAHPGLRGPRRVARRRGRRSVRPPVGDGRRRLRGAHAPARRALRGAGGRRRGGGRRAPGADRPHDDEHAGARRRRGRRREDERRDDLLPRRTPSSTCSTRGRPPRPARWRACRSRAGTAGSSSSATGSSRFTSIYEGGSEWMEPGLPTRHARRHGRHDGSGDRGRRVRRRRPPKGEWEEPFTPCASRSST